MMTDDLGEDAFQSWAGEFAAWSAMTADQAWQVPGEEGVWQVGQGWRIAQAKLRELVAIGRASGWLGGPIDDLSVWYDAVDAADEARGQEASDGPQADDPAEGDAGVEPA